MIRARQVLLDCESALADFESAGQTPFWRTRWVAVVASLRAVGHVLQKADTASDGALKQAVDRAWNKLKSEKPEPQVFWEFIEQERNNVLKVYEFGTGLNVTVQPSTGHMGFSGHVQTSPSQPTTYNSFIRSGVYGGRNAIEVCREAIAFWHGFLDEVERDAVASSKNAV